VTSQNSCIVERHVAEWYKRRHCWFFMATKLRELVTVFRRTCVAFLDRELCIY